MSHKSSYSKFFAPPKFLAMPSVSLEILPNAICFLSTKITEKGLLPDKFGLVSLEPGAVSHGEIIKRELVTKALIEIKKKTGAHFVRFSIPEEKTYIFKTHLPELAPKEVRDILDFKLEENIPLSSKEAVFDFDLIPKHKAQHGLDPIVSATALKFVEDWQAIFQSIDLIPLFFSGESNNIAKSVVKEGNEQAVVVANIKETNIILSLVVAGVVYQTSSVNFGSSTFTDLFCKYYKVPLAEGLKLKKEKLYSNNSENMEIFSYFINTISAIKDEIYKFLVYCNEREDVPHEVSKIILCGKDASIVGLSEYLALNLDLRVEIANIWVNNFSLDDYIPEISQLESLNYATVNGLNLF